MNWQVNDKAIFVSVSGDTNRPELYGKVCRLIRYEGQRPKVNISRAWYVEFDICDYTVNELCLREIPDDYDGLTISSWDELEDIWTPKVTA